MRKVTVARLLAKCAAAAGVGLHVDVSGYDHDDDNNKSSK